MSLAGSHDTEPPSETEPAPREPFVQDEFSLTGDLEEEEDAASERGGGP